MVAIIQKLSFLALIFGANLCIAAESISPKVKISGLRSGDGFVAISVYSAEKSGAFPEHSDQATQNHYVKLDGKTEIEIELKDLPPGKYAISAMHDEDSNQKFKTALGIPREGFGFSNNPRIVFGPPSFDKAATDITPESHISMQMKYLL